MHEWHHRITKETIEWLEETDLIKRWKADNTTEDRKPLIQMDTLVLMAKKFRNADANGNLVMDEQCKPYLPPPASQGQPVLGVWTNPSSPGMPCLLLRGACVGIGGQTLREYLDQSRMDEGGGSQPAAALFRYAFQEKWVMSPLHVRVVVHVQLQTEEFLCAGVTEAIEAAVQEVLGAEERTVRLEKVTAGDGRDYVPPPFGADLPTQLETLLFIKVLCGNDPVLAARREEQMARPALLEAVLNAARKDLHMRLPDGCVTLHVPPRPLPPAPRPALPCARVCAPRRCCASLICRSCWPGGDARRRGQAPPRTDSAARCDRCDGPFLAHVTDTRPEVVAGAQDKYAAMLGKVGYNGAVPAKDAWRTCILPLLTEEELRAREESQRIGWLRRLANLDFEDTEEVQALQALGLLDPGDPVKDAPHAGERAADYANLTEGATNDARRKIREPYWDLAGVDPSEDAELYAEAGTPENPLPAGLGMGPNGSFTDPVALETHTCAPPRPARRRRGGGAAGGRGLTGRGGQVGTPRGRRAVWGDQRGGAAAVLWRGWGGSQDGPPPPPPPPPPQNPTHTNL